MGRAFTPDSRGMGAELLFLLCVGAGEASGRVGSLTTRAGGGGDPVGFKPRDGALALLDDAIRLEGLAGIPGRPLPVFTGSVVVLGVFTGSCVSLSLLVPGRLGGLGGGVAPMLARGAGRGRGLEEGFRAGLPEGGEGGFSGSGMEEPLSSQNSLQ